MAAEGSSAALGSRSASGGATADSYIGSVISLTSKSEIRYEGILYNINTEESSIGLQSVRSFGTEGRKKDGPQVPPSDKVYEYILFRGSDIKDLQVKSSPTIQSTPPINNDPAIIQSHYPHPTGQPSSLPTAPGASLPDHGSNTSQVGLSGSNFQGGLPLYQPGGNLNSWGPPPSNANAGGLPMPMYWQGFYGAPGGLPQLPQQSMLVPPSGLQIPSSMQHMQFSGFRSSLPLAMPTLPTSGVQDHSLAPPSIPNSSSLTSNSIPPIFPLSIPPSQTGPPAPETSSSFPPNKAPSSAIAASMPISSLPQFARLPPSVSDISGAPPVAIKTISIPGPPALGTQQNLSSQRIEPIAASSGSVVSDVPTPPLVTPGQLLQPVANASTQILQTAQKDVEVVQVSPKQQSEPLVHSETEAQAPILPSLPNARIHQSNGNSHNSRNNNRGRGGRANMMPRPVTKFTEDFDFTAMNEKFNKDEVWGNLGKGNKSLSKDKEVYESSNTAEGVQDEDDHELQKIETRSVYNKDDFFDTLSCNALDNDPNHGRTRYSEQMKLDTETFGEFSRYRGGRGGRGPYRGGRGGRGSFHGRGYAGGRSHGFMARGRGRGVQGRLS